MGAPTDRLAACRGGSGAPLKNTLANLREAVALHLQGEDPADFGLVTHPTILVTMELEPVGLSGDEVVAILDKLGCAVHSQRGSEVKLRRVTSGGSVQTLTVPRHRENDLGTIHAIFRQARRFIAEDELRQEFYTD